MLTPRQRQLLLFLKAYIDEHAYAPTLDDMAEQLGFASKSSPFRLLTCLERRGFIRRLSQQQRAIEIIRMPPDWVGEKDARRSLQDLVSTYESGRFPSVEQWTEASLVLGHTDPAKRDRHHRHGPPL